MAEEGAAIAVFAVLNTAGEALVAELIGRGFPSRCWNVDVSNETNMHTAIDAAAAHFGRLDALVNNPGIAGVSKPTHEITEAE